MIQIRYPRITGATPEERQKQTENYLRYLIDQLNAQKSTPETTQKQESAIPASQPKIDFSKLFASYIADYWKTIYPVGAIFISVSETDPATLFGGKWEQIQDRFLLASGSSYPAKSTGGEAEHTLTVEEMPKHNHPGQVRVQGYDDWPRYTTSDYEVIHKWQGGDYFGANTTLNVANVSGVIIGNKGNSQPHNNMPPYVSVYMWKRIA